MRNFPIIITLLLTALLLILCGVRPDAALPHELEWVETDWTQVNQRAALVSLDVQDKEYVRPPASVTSPSVEEAKAKTRIEAQNKN